jgi:hypothetical protein
MFKFQISNYRNTSRHLPLLVAVAILATFLPICRADHGPGTSGGGVLTQSAEVLKPGKFAVEVREDFTQFESISAGASQEKAAKAGSFDLLDSSSITSLSLAYGVFENFQISASMGYYAASKAREVEFEDGESELTTYNPNGFTDLWLTGKYRVYRGPIGQFALMGGLKIPTGRWDVKNSAGELVEPSATAGSGSWDFLIGTAYSRFLTERWTVDTSFQYIFRTEAHGFQLGDRIDAGLATAYRLFGDAEHYPQLSVFGEVNFRYLMKTREQGALDDNTGGGSLFLTPGVRVGITKWCSLTVSSPLPVVQELNGEQLKTAYKITAGLSFSF